MKKHITIIVLAGLMILVASYFIFRDTTPTEEPDMGGTGGSFALEHEYIFGGARQPATTTTSTAVSSTTPIYFTAGSTTTVPVLTAGVSDLRLNIIAHATTTAEGAGPEITIVASARGNNGIDEYYETVLTTSGVSQIATPIKTYYWDASATTTTTTTLSPANENFASASIQISNFNAPYTVLSIGATTITDIYLEIVKVIPR